MHKREKATGNNENRQQKKENENEEVMVWS
jgi:hypothetical protein